MLQYFEHNDVFRNKFSGADTRVKSQLSSIFDRANRCGLDWYFTKIPDLRCGIKPDPGNRADDVCFLIKINAKIKDAYVHVGRLQRAGFFPKSSPSRLSFPLKDQSFDDLIEAINKFAKNRDTIGSRVGSLPTYAAILADQVRAALKDKPEARKQRLENAAPKPNVFTTIVKRYNRNPDVIAEALFRAQGKCEGCRQNAPFLKANTNEPFLEVHHKIPLSDNGDDTVENVIALCPNCHRERHYGQDYVEG
jgi:5-methylcytosine-specific restriction endonuclease McrA